jgi:hypothetical protein
LESEDGEAGDVGCGGEEVEVGVDLASAAESGSSSAVLASHQMAELALDFGAGGPVVVGPVESLLLTAGIGEALLVATNADGASISGVGALGSQRTVGAGVAEIGDPVALGVAADGDGDAGRAGDGVGVEVEAKRSLANSPPAAVGRWVLQRESMPCSARRSKKPPVP